MSDNLPGSVLIIEDSPFQSKLIRKHIQLTSDFPVYEAHSMKETEEVLQAYSSDIFLALVDLNLEDAPDGQALDLCLQWKVPAIVLTARFDDNVRRKCIDKHVVDYFLKGNIAEMDPLFHTIERIHKNQSVKALVVDDSHIQRKMLCMLLNIQRIQAIEAESGEEALTIIDQHPDISLLVTDFHMPGMSGLELVRHLRIHHRIDQLSIIGLSSAGSGSVVARFLKHGANDFLTKPFEVEEFYWRINQSLENQDMLRRLRGMRGR